MHGPEGINYPLEGVFRAVVPFEQIVTTDEFPEDFKPPQPIDLLIRPRRRQRPPS